MEEICETERVEQQGRLQIVVARYCAACEEARAIGLEMQVTFPKLAVDLVEIDGSHPVPDGVVATPTYLLDGAVISLGNPRREMLVDEIRRRQDLEP